MQQTSDLAIAIEHVSKCFKRYARPFDRLKDMLLPGTSRSEDFWALQDITLKVDRGEGLGIIGRNGSGKSTLLQIIAGTLQPTAGTVWVNGRISALLELGSGFNPEFTGRQNVFFNGRLLGLTQRQVETKLDQILSFADIGDFIDQPVKTYSSGMFVRLAFAVAANCEPQILIVDEALAVGDIFFQQKCYRFLEELRSQGTAILFVSHDTDAVLRLCDRAVILQTGHLTHAGTPAEIVPKYTELYYSQLMEKSALKVPLPDPTPIQSVPSAPLAEPLDPTGLVEVRDYIYEFPDKNRYGCAVGLIAGIAITDQAGNRQSLFCVGAEMVISVKVNAYPQELSTLNIGFQLSDRLGQILIGSNTQMLSLPITPERLGQSFICQFRFPLDIAPQPYTLDIAVAEYHDQVEVIYDWINQVETIHVILAEAPAQCGVCYPTIAAKIY
jgi:lipopolysaccharide transport system ATP-binding protein